MTQSVNGVRLLHHREPQTFTRDGTTVVFGANGCLFPISAELYRGGAKVVAELTQRVDPALWYDESKFTAAED